MPDWSYHPLKKLLLDRLKPKNSREFLHRTMSTIASIPGGSSLINFLGHMSPSDEVGKDINHTTRVLSPVGLASNIDPHLSGMNAFQELGFGFIEIGPIVLNEPKTQIEPAIDDRAILFLNQPEKVPLKLAIKKLTKLDMKIPIFARIDKQVKRSEWDIIVQHLTPFVDGFIGTREQVESYVHHDIGIEHSYYIALSSEDVISTEELQLINNHPWIGGVIVHAPQFKQGEYWREVTNANEKLIHLVKQMKALHPNLIIITSGGVETPDEAYQVVRAGADLLLLEEGYVRAGPGLPKRIHERLLYGRNSSTKRESWYWSFLFGFSILIGGMIALYFAFTRIILPYDESFIGLTRDEILQVNPLILAFLSHDRMALAGTMISGGILYIQLARHGIKKGLHWAKITFHAAAIIGFLGILLFIGFGYFDWLHGLFWLLLMPIYYFSWKEGKQATASPFSNHGENDRAWKLGLYGQLMFVILGFSILIGGIVISTIGVSNVFVDTDLTFLCMTPQMLNELSETLIPVIAHDRAGFGSALVSVGLLVLMISLWGFRKGERWIWNTLALGALPAFIAGIGTHFYIGYTTFIHLLPVYFLVGLYILGLVFSYNFLKKK
ncbi:hypothetical protein [Bacillus sp. JCM 19041]|uniref:hypothetical protein n=1 Tax=Bacillus sp. JCM 19041 TaxID=1460637 RepID=UPI0006D1EDB2